MQTTLLFILFVAINLPITAQWTKANAPADRLFTFTSVPDGKIFAGSENIGLLASTDGGLSFSVFNTGVAGFSYDVRSLESRG